MPKRRIGPLFAVFVAFVVLMASNVWLKGIFGYGVIATDIPFCWRARSCPWLGLAVQPA